jgi:hypothetical protein
MSVWTDLHKRSNGITVSQEDFHLIYGERDDVDILCEEKYKDGTYKVMTNGMYPFLEIIFNRGLSIFSGKDVVRLKSDSGEYYDLGRLYGDGHTYFNYWFNKPEDHIEVGADPDMMVEKPHPGHKYTLDELKQIAEMFIDLIHQCESELTNHME